MASDTYNAKELEIELKPIYELNKLKHLEGTTFTSEMGLKGNIIQVNEDTNKIKLSLNSARLITKTIINSFISDFLKMNLEDLWEPVLSFSETLSGGSKKFKKSKNKKIKKSYF